ncbi:MAG TPA: FeoA family protein [Vicinamibacterales bacterium]|nr:FeoA family protein [Vicinamibacterales bacterium]
MTELIEYHMRLSSVAAHQRARVIRLLQDHLPHAHRLAALGVTPGTTVTVLQTFPGMIFQCDETELAIEPDVARLIVVEILGT